MIPAYNAGYQAWLDGKPATACPYGHEGSRETDSQQEREQSPLCLRHWWLAGWHDADRETA